MDIMSMNASDIVPKKIKEIVDRLLDYMKNGNAHSGYPLEVVANGLINARLLSLAKITLPGFSSSFKICQLFLIEDPYMVSVKPAAKINKVRATRNLLLANCKICYSDIDFCERSMILRKSYNNERNPKNKGFFFVADANDPIDECTNLTLLSLHPNECADGGWLFRSSLNNKISTLMINCKSKREVSLVERVEESISMIMPKTNFSSQDRQSQYFNSFPKKNNQFSCESRFKVQESSVAHSIQEEDTVAVYLTRTEKMPSIIADRGELILGDVDTRRFLGFLEPLYVVSRMLTEE